MTQNGKGDAPRPFSVPQETYKSNYERIFGKKEDTCEYSGLPSTQSYDDPTEAPFEYIAVRNSGKQHFAHAPRGQLHPSAAAERQLPQQGRPQGIA